MVPGIEVKDTGGYRLNCWSSSRRPQASRVHSTPARERNGILLTCRIAGVAGTYIYAQHGIVTHGLWTLQRLKPRLSHHSDREYDRRFGAPDSFLDPVQHRMRIDQLWHVQAL